MNMIFVWRSVYLWNALENIWESIFYVLYVYVHVPYVRQILKNF